MSAKDDFKRVDKMFEDRKKNAGSDRPLHVLVGYTAAYALFVHENMNPKTLGTATPRPSGLGVYWGPAAPNPMFLPKFLEGPARVFKQEIIAVVAKAFKQGLPMIQCLLLGGLRLQRESMLKVPVEYGHLRATAFTREDDGA